MRTLVSTDKLAVAVVAKGECAVKKIFKTTAGLTPVILVLTLFCSNPVKDVAWRTSIDLPITANKKFLLGAMMDTLFFNKQQVATTTTYDTIKRTGLPNLIDTVKDTTMKIINAYPMLDTIKRAGKPDTIVTVADTVQFGFPTKDSASDTISQDSLADKYYSDVFGPIPLSGVPATAVSIPLSGAYASGAAVSAPAVPIKLKWIYHVQFSDTVQFLTVGVTNNSPANFSQVIITLGTLGTDTINTLQANTTATIEYNVRAMAIDSVVSVAMSFTPSNSGSFAAGNNLAASLSFNNLYASKVTVLDSALASYQRMFTNEYNLTDTVDVSYIDISEGVFVYRVTNYTKLNLLLNVTHENLWFTSFCAQRNITTAAQLAGQDSSPANYNGRVAITSYATPDTTLEYSNNNISADRLFPEWDSTKQKSVTKVDYLVKFQISSAGTPITISSGDSLSFVIKTSFFKFKQMVGTSMDEYHRTGTPGNIPVQLPWSKAVTDSLRNHFVLNKVYAKTLTRITIPQGALIDRVLIHHDIASSVDSAVKTSSDDTLLHVTRDSLFERTVDITNVVNNYPDSVKVNIALTIPVGTQIVAVNDLTNPTDSAYNKYIGRMVLHGNVNYNLVAPLCWTVVDTTIMDLGGTKVDLTGGSGVLNIFNDMTDRHASLNVKVTNSTNLYLRLFALVATADTNQVDSLTDTGYVNVKAGTRYVNTNEFTDLIKNPKPGFVNLLGGGLLIPPRDSTYSNSIALGDSALEKITSAKEIGWRWQVRFLPQPAGVAVPDALSNTDWIKLNSWIHVDGVNSINKLIK